jgi:Fatty acid/phospholipid biosynthesis enzyme
MGSVYSRHVLHYKNPTVGLVSLGDEDVKGTELTKEVFKMLRPSSLNFVGNIEGRHLFEIRLKLSCATDSLATYLENVRIDRGGDVSMAQARAHAHTDAKGWRIPREECHWNN